MVKERFHNHSFTFPGLFQYRSLSVYFTNGTVLELFPTIPALERVKPIWFNSIFSSLLGKMPNGLKVVAPCTAISFFQRHPKNYKDFCIWLSFKNCSPLKIRLDSTLHLSEELAKFKNTRFRDFSNQ